MVKLFSFSSHFPFSFPSSPAFALRIRSQLFLLLFSSFFFLFFLFLLPKASQPTQANDLVVIPRGVLYKGKGKGKGGGVMGGDVQLSCFFILSFLSPLPSPFYYDRYFVFKSPGLLLSPVFLCMLKVRQRVIKNKN